MTAVTAGAPGLAVEADEGQSILAWLNLIEWVSPNLMMAAGWSILVCGQDDVATVLERLAKVRVRIMGRAYHPVREGWLLGIRPIDLGRAKRALKGVLVDTGRSS